MATVETIDHLLAGGIVALAVAQAFADPYKLKGVPRVAFFKAGAATGIALGFAVILLQRVDNGALADFGLYGWAGSPAIAVSLAFAWVVVLLIAMGLCRGLFRDRALPYYRRYEHLMPARRDELPAAYAAAVFAGIGEEIAFRGFLLWYVEALAGLTAAVLVSSLIFGIAHGYQGRLGMTFATVAGIILALAYVASGSLLLVIWMHATYNVASFTLGYQLLREAKPEGPATAAAGD